MVKTAKKPDKVDLLLKELASATESTLTRLDEKIAAKEKQIEELLGEHTKELDAFKAMRKLLSVRIHGKPPRVPQKAKAEKPASNRYRNGVAEIDLTPRRGRPPNGAPPNPVREKVLRRGGTGLRGSSRLGGERRHQVAAARRAADSRDEDRGQADPI
jgi:hypothetical protein